MKQENEKQKLEFSRRLRLSMSKRNMKAIELSNLTGIDKGALSNYMKAKYMPKNDKMYLLAQALDVSPAWLSGIDLRLNPTEGLDSVSVPVHLSNDTDYLNSGTDFTERNDDSISLMVCGMAKLTQEERKKLLDMARVMFPDAFPE